MEVATGEAHNWLAPVEQKHQVVRKALEHYMAEKGASTIKNSEEACIYVPQSMVNGFSHAQWVFGKTPASSHFLTVEVFNPGFDAIDDASRFAEVQRKRCTAQKAWIQADSDTKLRRAMNKIFKETKEDVQIGQKVRFWREAEGKVAKTSKSCGRRGQ